MRYLSLLFIVISFMACKTPVKKDTKPTESTTQNVTDEMMENAIIYEANIRQYSKEGTFNAFTKDIPSLKNLGVKIIWLMPIHPISMTKRKATGDTFVADIKDPEEQQKYLGSYYAVSDYRGINPEFGTKDDLRKLVKTAHDNGMFVLLDWVPNHTGWDHHWLKDHPEFYTKNADGDITDPLNDKGESMGWQDVADLNYDNQGLRQAMISDMMYWITDEEIDGFRCDVAGSVPVAFWEEAIPQLRAQKDIFMLAEAWEPELLKGKNLFDMCYGWEPHFLLVDIAKGKKNVSDWDQYMNHRNHQYEQDDIIMNFITNHDENSWKGTVEESFGETKEIMSVLTYMIPGMPLIYSGQEYDLNHRLKFFEKDEVPKTKGFFYPLYEKLAILKSDNPALDGGKQAGIYQRIKTSDDQNILAFLREKNGQKIYFIGNLSAKPLDLSIELDGHFKALFNNTDITLSKQKNMTLLPWQYLILE